MAHGEANFRALYKERKKGAIKRGLEWILTEEEFRSLTQQVCYYCGAPPYQRRSHGVSLNGDYIYNGLDRFDNDQGYIHGNCVPCCGKCNHAKYTMSADEFLKHIIKIYEYQRANNPLVLEGN